MSRTQTRYDCDQGYTDGIIWLSYNNFAAYGTAPTATRTAKGNYSWAQGSSLTNQYVATLSKTLFRLGLRDYTQNAFGAGGLGNLPYGASNGDLVGSPTTQSTASVTAKGPGVAVNIAVKYSGLFTVGKHVVLDVGGTYPEVQVITAIPDTTHITVAQVIYNHTSVFQITQGAFTTSAGVSGPPPFTGVTQFTPVTAPRPKGILIRGFEVVYQVGTAALTSISLGLSQTTYKNATALSITDILAAGTNGLATANAATPYVIPVALVTPAYLTSDLTEYDLEIIAVTPSTSTFNLYGAFVYVTYNYN